MSEKVGIIVLLLAIGALSYYYVRHGSLPSMPEFLKQRRLDNDVLEHASPPTAAPTAPSPESVAFSVPDAVASDDVGAWHHYPNTDHVGNDIEHLRVPAMCLSYNGVATQILIARHSTRQDTSNTSLCRG